MKSSDVTITRHGSRAALSAPQNYDITKNLPPAINLSFVDGHVEMSVLENLWNFQWHYGYVVPSPRPGR